MLTWSELLQVNPLSSLCSPKPKQVRCKNKLQVRIAWIRSWLPQDAIKQDTKLLYVPGHSFIGAGLQVCSALWQVHIPVWIGFLHHFQWKIHLKPGIVGCLSTRWLSFLIKTWYSFSSLILTCVCLRWRLKLGIFLESSKETGMANRPKTS